MKYVIDEKDLIKLIANDWELNNLYNYGVDNWEGMCEISEDDLFTKEDIEKYIKENFETLNKDNDIVKQYFEDMSKEEL